jgi:hypothetical protein
MHRRDAEDAEVAQRITDGLGLPCLAFEGGRLTLTLCQEPLLTRTAGFSGVSGPAVLEAKLDPDPVVIGQSNTLIFRNVPQLLNSRTVQKSPVVL